MTEESIEFVYKVNNLPGKVRRVNPFESAKAPRNRSKLNMYLLFIMGSLALVTLSTIAVHDVNFYGTQTYWQYFSVYWQKYGLNATFTSAIMLFINIFWIVINILVEFLANSQNWIPERKVVEENDRITLLPKTKFSTGEEIINSRIEHESAQVAAEILEDKQEYEAILASAALSPLALIWLNFKRVYRFASRVPRRLTLIWQNLLQWNEEFWQNLQDIIKNTWEIIIYFLNPLNIIEEIIDFAVIVLVKFLYPVLLTPIIFFLPVKLEYTFHAWWEIVIYFFLIGGLRIGVEFFSIYIRFLRNTRS